MKPKELAHDSQLYRAYLHSAERLQRGGSTVRRVSLDYELKRDYQRFLRELNRDRRRAERDADDAARFRSEVLRHKLEAVVAHDSYLINLASPDPALRRRSIASFTMELERSRALGLRAVVSHPGNYMDDREAGLERNARGYAECLAVVPGDLQVWIEGTAG